MNVRDNALNEDKSPSVDSCGEAFEKFELDHLRRHASGMIFQGFSSTFLHLEPLYGLGLGASSPGRRSYVSFEKRCRAVLESLEVPKAKDFAGL